MGRVDDPETLRRAEHLLGLLSREQRVRLRDEWGLPLEDPDLVGCGVYSCAWVAYAPDGRDCVVKITDDEQTAAALEKIRQSGGKHDSILVRVYWVGEAQPPGDRHAGVWVAVTELLDPLGSFADLEKDRDRIMEKKSVELDRALRKLKIDRRGLELHSGNWGFRDPTDNESLVFFDFSFSDEWLRGRPPLPRLNPPPLWVSGALTDDRSWAGPPATPVVARLAGRVPEAWLPARKDGVLADELGCGLYGCVLRTNDPSVVLKLTADEEESVFVAWMISLGDQAPSDGIVRYWSILATDATHRVPHYDEAKRERAKRDPYASPVEPEGYFELPVCLIWREAALHVGLLDLRTPPPEPRPPAPDARPTGFAARVLEAEWRKEQEEWGGLASPTFEEFLEKRRDWSARLRARHESELERWRSTRWFTPAEIDAASHLWALLYNYRMVSRELGRRVKDARESGARLDDHELTRGASRVAETIESVGRLPQGRWIAKTLRQLLDLGVILRDVHNDNVGLVRRDGEERWVVTDPSQAVFLRGAPAVTIPPV